jgi:hypothetical protein
MPEWWSYDSVVLFLVVAILVVVGTMVVMVMV